MFACVRSALTHRTRGVPTRNSTTAIRQLPSVEQAVVYSTSTTGLSTLTFRGEGVADGGGVEERSEVMYCIEVRTYIYYKEA